MPGAVVELALLLRERPPLGQRMQRLEDFGGAGEASVGHLVGVGPVANLPVQLGIAALGLEKLEDRLDLLGLGHVAQPDRGELGTRHHHGRAVLLALHGEKLGFDAADLLDLDAGDPAHALVRVDHTLPDLELVLSNGGGWREIHGDLS